VIGGGVFGCFAAVVLAELGHSVVIIEQESELMKRASFNNQARLHTGLHYPRSLLTAQESLTGYHKFRKRYGEAVSDFTQIYAISRQNSTTQAPDFGSFINRLGVSVEEVDVDKWFNSGSISQAFRVDEPTFDSAILREMLLEEIANYQDISLVFNNAVVGGGPQRICTWNSQMERGFMRREL
jgi:glycine/D-amino acid oxidase-like deaminating enzyme